MEQDINKIKQEISEMAKKYGIRFIIFKTTGRDITVHIKQDDGRIWYCPENNIVEVKE